MNIKKLAVLIIAVFSLVDSIACQEQLPDTSHLNQGIKYEGFTKTLVNLIKSRPRPEFYIGAYEISPESLLEDDIAEVFDCDSVIMKYLSEAGEEATYGMLSYEMKTEIESHFNYTDGYLFVIVNSDTTADGIYFNISISRSKPFTLPVVLHASDTSFSTEFDTICKIVFTADIDLYVNAALALSDSQSKAVQVRINSFDVNITSLSDDETSYGECFNSETGNEDLLAMVQDPQRFVPFDLTGKKYIASPRCFILLINQSWNLSPANPDDDIEEEEGSPLLSFEQIEKGDFTWQEWHTGSLETVLVVMPADEEWNSLPESSNRGEFHYSVDDLFDQNSLEQISFCCYYYIGDEITARTTKEFYKP